VCVCRCSSSSVADAGDTAGVNVEELDPCMLFVTLLDTTGFNYSLLLDFITSPETCFLVYIVRTLKHITRSWSRWTEVCRDYVCRSTWTANQSRWSVDSEISDHRGGDECQLRSWSSLHRHGASSMDDNSSLDADPVKRRRVAMVTSSPASAANQQQRPAVVDYSSSSGEDEFASSIDRHHQMSSISRDNLSSNAVPQNDVSHDNLSCSVVPLNNVSCDNNDIHGKERSLVFESAGDRPIVETGCTQRRRNVTLERVMTVLAQLHTVLSRLVINDVFPFHAGPLLRLLQHCQELYNTSLIS